MLCITSLLHVWLLTLLGILQPLCRLQLSVTPSSLCCPPLWPALLSFHPWFWVTANKHALVECFLQEEQKVTSSHIPKANQCPLSVPYIVQTQYVWPFSLASKAPSAMTFIHLAQGVAARPWLYPESILGLWSGWRNSNGDISTIAKTQMTLMLCCAEEPTPGKFTSSQLSYRMCPRAQPVDNNLHITYFSCKSEQAQNPSET